MFNPTYESKYLKYKNKYLTLKNNLKTGGNPEDLLPKGLLDDDDSDDSKLKPVLSAPSHPVLTLPSRASFLPTFDGYKPGPVVPEPAILPENLSMMAKLSSVFTSLLPGSAPASAPKSLGVASALASSVVASAPKPLLFAPTSLSVPAPAPLSLPVSMPAPVAVTAPLSLSTPLPAPVLSSSHVRGNIILPVVAEKTESTGSMFSAFMNESKKKSVFSSFGNVASSRDVVQNEDEIPDIILDTPSYEGVLPGSPMRKPVNLSNVLPTNNSYIRSLPGSPQFSRNESMSLANFLPVKQLAVRQRKVVQ
jgi:hypothetical protein